MKHTKKPAAMAVANGHLNNSTTDFKVNYSWTLPALATVENDLHWFNITNNHPTVATISGYGADRYYEMPPSTLDCLVINLPWDIDPLMYSWPVCSLDVVLVECGCLERQMIELCYKYGASSITLQEHTLQTYTLPSAGHGGWQHD